MGKVFLNIIDKNFKKGDKLRTIFNRNTCKISYRTTQNLGSIISSHNKKLIKNFDRIPERECNCRIKEKCPLNNKCLSKNLIYQATVEPEKNNKNIKTEYYIGLSSTTFKARLANHVACEKNRSKEVACKLAQYLWRLKDKQIKYNVTWKMLCRASTYTVSSNICNLCTNEKIYILHHPEMCTINERIELK